MIFPTDSISRLRGELEDRVSAGELSEVEAYREALVADPEDPRALRLLALYAEDAGDFDDASDLAWRWLRADPLSHEAFRLIGRLLSRDPAQARRGAAYLALGKEKLHYDPEAESDSDSSGPGSAETDGDEPAEVTHELEPHRLLHTMWTASTGAVEPELISRILARGPDIAPYLTGILNLHGEDLLDDVDEALVVRALALLGEIGDVAAIPALVRFIPLENESFHETSIWALQRIAFRKPVEVLRELNLLIPTEGPFDLAALAQQISMIPAIPGRMEALLAIEKRIPEFTSNERAAVALGLIASAFLMEGSNSAAGTRFLREYGNLLPAEARRELKEVRTKMENEPPYEAEESETSVYDICCSEFEPVEEDQPIVRSMPKIGRNEPCWCGSGKKYKKCHLAADESR